MSQGTFFPSTQHLLAALQAVMDPALWQAKTRRIQYEGPRHEAAWLLEGPELPDPSCGAWRTDDISGALICELHGTSVAFQRRHTADFASLAQAMPLVPATSATPRLVYYDCSSEAHFATAVREALAIGCDRLAAAAHGRGALLRVQQPSAFLLARWQAAGEGALYQASAARNDVGTPLGFEYPLADRLLAHETPAVMLLDETGEWRRLPARFRDVYELLFIDRQSLVVQDVAITQHWPRVDVALRLTATEEFSTPSLWRLTADQLPLLTRALTESSEADLQQLQVAVVRLGNAGVDQFVVLRQTGAQGLPPPALDGGSAFVDLLAAERLYVPAGQRVEPVLSRRGLVETLGLSEQQVTLIEPDATGRLGLVRIALTAFRPLTDVVHYTLAGALPAVEALLARVQVDLDLRGSATGNGEDVTSNWKQRWRRLISRRHR